MPAKMPTAIRAALQQTKVAIDLETLATGGRLYRWTGGRPDSRTGNRRIGNSRTANGRIGANKRQVV